jgi:hypothetical protein
VEGVAAKAVDTKNGAAEVWRRGCKEASYYHIGERTSGSQICKPRGVKVDRTGVVCGELANGEKRMTYLRSNNKDVGETKRTRSRAHRGDRKT